MIVITGASGLVGSALSASLNARGQPVRHLVRREPRTGEAAWDPERGSLDANALDGADVVINLAGESLAQRWTSDVRRRIRESRVRGTSLISRAIAALPTKPRLLVNASAIGIYGNRGDEPLDEDSTLGDDFLAGVCKEWEAATTPARDAGVQVVLMRTAMVLSRKGGALPELLTPFRLGVGGRFGSGRQWVSWIGLGDLVRALSFIITSRTLSGPVNLTSPNPVRNAEFASTLGKVLGRPTVIPIPALAISLLFGEMGKDTVLASQRVAPRRLVASGFEFEEPTLDTALRHELSAPVRR